MKIPRQEYPRPQFVRDCWLNLNGEWEFSFDDENIGQKSDWYSSPQFKEKIIVPYVFQSKLSGISKQEFHDIVWYSKEFNLPENMKGKRIILHFGAVDYLADIWVNGQYCRTHEGGHVPFEVEITNLLCAETNLLVVRVQDFSKDLDLPRGKQYWKPKSEAIFYTGTTGIWQTVWLEAVSDTFIQKIWVTPEVDKRYALIEYEINGCAQNSTLYVEASLNGKIFFKSAISDPAGLGKILITFENDLIIDGDVLWSPENPVLIDLKCSLSKSDLVYDEIKSYFGMRKVSIQAGKFMLNNKPYYQKMLLDQGYWEDSLLTAPADEDFIKDIDLSKRMGFNGVRKHQKVEDPRFLYWADKMGFLVWGETANAFAYSRKYANRFIGEWLEMIKRDYNHPCIVAWTPINESWGVPMVMNNLDEQAHCTSLYWITKSLDQTRPVISNDGWEHTKTDLLTIHDYEHRKDVLVCRYASIDSISDTRHSGRGIFAEGWHYEGQPIIMSEFGGISYKKSDWSGWGYSSAGSDEDFARRYYDVVSAMLASELIQGFVYTQITDVEQEINGLLTYRREPKIDPDIIRQINEGKWKLD